MCSCHSILECCVTFSGVKLSIRSFVLFVVETKFFKKKSGMLILATCYIYLTLIILFYVYFLYRKS